MTREEILALEPGPELDRLIAERVMGWKLESDPELPRAWLRYDSEQAKWVWAGWWAEEPPIEKDPDTGEEYVPTAWLLAGSKVWSPSRDIAAAWEVVEKLLDHGFSVDLYSRSRGRWEVVLSDGDTLIVATATAEKPPLAICRVALLALGVNDEG